MSIQSLCTIRVTNNYKITIATVIACSCKKNYTGSGCMNRGSQGYGQVYCIIIMNTLAFYSPWHRIYIISDEVLNGMIDVILCISGDTVTQILNRRVTFC